MAVGITAWHPGSAPSSFRAVVGHMCTWLVVLRGESGTQSEVPAPWLLI